VKKPYAVKKPYTLLLVLIAIIIGLCLSPASAQIEREFLILVYLCGTDLETEYGAASEDLMEMIEAGLELDGPVTVLVQAGGTKKWRGNLVKSGESQRFLVADDLYPVGPSLGRQDMGKPGTLRDFVRFGLDTYPANRVGLLMWNHGSGSTGGLCYDEISGNALSTPDIHNALAEALAGRDQRFSFIGFDACLMSTFEVAAYMQPFADFMIASEELEPGTGWAYDQWLGDLARNPKMDMEAIGRSMVDSFIESSLAVDPDDYVTLAVTDLRELDELIAAVDAFGEELRDVLANGDFPLISRARAQMRAFGDFYDAGSDMVDIADIAWYLRDIAPDKSKALTRAAKNAVVYSRNSANIQSAVGLSILLPEKTKNSAHEYMPAYDPRALMSGYSDFVVVYLDELLSGSAHSFSPAPIQSIDIDPDDGASLGWLDSFFGGASQQSAPPVGSWLDSVQSAGSQPSLSYEDYEDIADIFGGVAYTVQLSQTDLASLSYVEAALLQDAYGQVDEDEYGDEAYFDFGLMQDVYVDWDDGTIYGLFDGTWPTLEGQMVPMYDQIVSDDYVRSLIPALVNDEEQFLLVVFNEDNPYGAVVGYTEGYDSNGNPARGYQKLEPGDVIHPMFDLIYWDETGEMWTDTFYGEEIIVRHQPLDFGYEPVEPGDYSYAFCLNDVYGGYEFTDFIDLYFD